METEAKRAEAQGYRVTTGVMSDTDALKRAVDPRFVADIETMLDETGAPDSVLDAVWQRWLATLPDQSLRTRRIHRKGTPGYSSDALRAFTHHVFHGSHQLARLKYGLEMTDALDEAELEAEQASNPVRTKLTVDEMKRRHEFTMNPVGGPIASAITNAMFIYYLGATPAAAAVNLSQTTVVGPAVLGAKFKGGVRGGIREIARRRQGIRPGEGRSAEIRPPDAGREGGACRGHPSRRDRQDPGA